MSAPGAQQQLGDGMYSKLIDDEDPELRPELSLRASPSVAHVPQTLRGPGLYRGATFVLAALCVILLICVIAVSTHYKNKQANGGELAPDAQKQEQEAGATCANVSELKSTITRLQEENRLLWARVNTTTAPAVVQPTVAPVQCPPEWLQFQSSCYFISRYSRSWAESQSFCESQGAHLAIIHTAEEQTFIWNQLPRGHWNAYWFGITDYHTEDQWKWVDGTPLVGGFWEVGEPNNHIDEDCGYIVKTLVLERVPIRSWYDAPCSMYWPFICEREMGPGASTALPH